MSVSASPDEAATPDIASMTRQRRRYLRFRSRTPLDQRMAVFEASAGRAYSGSPRALYREFLGSQRFADHQLVWALRAPLAQAMAARGYDVQGLERADAPSGGVDLDVALGAPALEELRRATIVVRGSDPYLLACARAGYVIADSLLPEYMTPREFQSFIQAWSGTPLKRFGCDVSSRDVAIRERFEFEGRRMTYAISPSQFATQNLVSAFCLGRTKRTTAIVQAGCPASDSLLNATARQVSAIRERFALPPDKKVVLWAPSASEMPHGDGHGCPPTAPFDLDSLKESLSEKFVLLVRDAKVSAEALKRSDGFAKDVTAVSDINDLYLISDVLVTDYSSSVIQYANLNRPIVIYARGGLSSTAAECGLYIEPTVLPARFAAGSRNLIEAIVAAVESQDGQQAHELYDTFNQRFNPLADGQSARRALERTAIEDPRVIDPPTQIEHLTNRARRALNSAKKDVKRVVFSAAKRSSAVNVASRTLLSVRRRLNYRKHCRQNPVDPKMIVFEAFVGWKYTCNPRALYEAVLNDPAFDDYTLVWAFRSPKAYEGLPALSRATLVRYGSQEYYAAHARARYWVSNSVVFPHMKLREGQVYVQTWHGTPLKRLGCDIGATLKSGAKVDAEEKRGWYEAEGRRFTFLLAQSEFAAKALTSAFGLTASGRADTVLTEGYPRNDVLTTHTDADTRLIREELGLPDDKKVILYAPTWRDDQHEEGVGYTLDVGLDFDELKRELGDTHVVLFRAHYLIASAFQFESYGGFVRDVSAIDDINELYMASDMLITDYSSVFFDYANLRRPVLFYMYDLESYAEQIRGFYLGLDELPGPVIQHQPELVEAIRDAASPGEAARRRLDEFARRFASLDDGHSSERVLAHMLASPGHKTT
jgi:CDP-glycerol glycerophosphotransferase